MDVEKLVFLDETWASTSMARRYGRAPRGQRCIGAAALLALGALYLLRRVMPASGRLGDLLLLAAGTAVWLAVVAATLKLSGSKLPGQLMARFSKPAA